MLQSCGKSTVRHAASLNDGASAPAGSPRKNFQFASAASCCRGDFGCAVRRGRGRNKQRGQKVEGNQAKHSLHTVISFCVADEIELHTPRPARSRPQAEQDNAHRFAEQQPNRLPVLLLHPIPQ